MRRRDFITGITGAAAAWSLVAHAQQSSMPVIGYLSIYSPRFDAARLSAFRQGLGEMGYVEGRNLEGAYRYADGHNEQLPMLAADLVRRPVALIAAIGGPAPALAAKAATTSIPIVFTIPGDPVKQGLVDGLNHPGGNLTGISNLAGVVVAKQLEVLHQTVPKAALIGLLVNPRQSDCRFLHKRHGGCGKHDWTEAFCCESRQRKRLRAGLRRPGETARGRNSRAFRCAVQQSSQRTRGAGGTLCAARDLRLQRVR